MNPSKHKQTPEVSVDFEQKLLAKVGDRQTVSAILKKIQTWAGGQPLLTQLVWNYTLKEASAIAYSQDPTLVDRIVQQEIIQNWQTGDAARHLNRIQSTLSKYEPKDSLLILYLQILKRGHLPQNESPEQSLLLRTGLVRLEEQQLIVGNQIYASIFNEAWIERQLPGITRPVAIVKGSSPALALTSRTSSQLDRSAPLAYGLSLKEFLIASVLVLLLTATTLIYTKKPASQVADAKTEDNTAAIANADNAQSTVQLTLLGDTFSGYSTFRDADFQSVLTSAGIDIQYADEFDQALRAQRLNQGEADLLVTTLDQFLQQQPQGKIVGLLDRTVGADAVVLNTQQYKTLTSLLNLDQLVAQAKSKGEKLSITYAADTPSEYLALVLDTQFDSFNLSDFTLKPVADASEAWALMQDPAEKVAIAVLWEPYVAQAQKQGYSVVLSSKDAPSVIVDVIVASDKLIQSNPEVISQLLEKYYRRIDANIRDATQLQAQVAKDGNLLANEATAVINGIDFFTATEAKNWLTDGTLSKRIESTAAILTLSNRLSDVPTNPTTLFATTFVTEAANNTQALIDLIKADNPEIAAKLEGTQPTILPTVQQSASDGSLGADIGNIQVRGQVSFDLSSAQLTPEGQQTISQLATELQSFNADTVAVRVIGHTSRTGSPQANLSLSQARAAVVAEQLKQAGVKLQIISEGKGFSEPLPNTPPTDPNNQRTEIRLVRVNESE